MSTAVALLAVATLGCGPELRGAARRGSAAEARPSPPASPARATDPYALELGPDDRPSRRVRIRPGRIYDARAERWHDSLATAARGLRKARVVFVGERHDHRAHHRVQAALIDLLRRGDDGADHGNDGSEGTGKGAPLLVGLEMFERRPGTQAVLDRWVAGELSEKEMVRRSGWYDQWGFDYRYYRRVFRLARAHRIRLVALNVPLSLARRVGRQGLGALPAAERERLPALWLDFPRHRRLFRALLGLPPRPPRRRASPPGRPTTHRALPPGHPRTHRALPPGPPRPRRALPPGHPRAHRAPKPGHPRPRRALPPGHPRTHRAPPPGHPRPRRALPPGHPRPRRADGAGPLRRKGHPGPGRRHPHLRMLHRLFAAQVLRDEVMAETIQRALTAAGPRARMVVLVGNGHLAFGTGVNARLARRWPTATQRTVMCVSVPVPPWSRPVSTGLADVLVGTVAHGWKQRYPSLGVRIRDRPAPGGGVTVRGLRRGPSPAREAGLRPGDVITHLDGDPVADPFALRWALSRKSWGDALRLRWRRDGQAHRARVVLRRPTPKEADRKSRR